MKKISNRKKKKKKKLKKYTYTMSLVSCIQWNPNLFSKVKTKLSKKPTKKKDDKEEKKKNMIYNTFVLVQDILSFVYPS